MPHRPQLSDGLCGAAVDLHVSRLVDYTLGIHAMILEVPFVGR